MDEHLKFSWGHIIAFLALIFISYITFVGVTYSTDGDFMEAVIKMVIVDVFLALVFLGAQYAKATSRKFARWIRFERICIFCSPIVFILCMLPYLHFWTVHSKNDEVVSKFTSAIKASKQMFDDYEVYANTRIENYEHNLQRAIDNRSINPELFSQCGFIVGKEEIQKQNMVKTLRLQLLSSNYDSLKVSATKWIDDASEGASTWNVFLLGNTKEIKTAITDWNSQLSKFASKKLSNEEVYGQVDDFEAQSNSLESVKQGLDSLTADFTKKSFPGAVGIITMIILYFAMLFPYFLQDRHTKSVFRLFGKEKRSGCGLGPIEYYPIGPIDTSDIDETTGGSSKQDNNSDDDFESFTLN